jgi:hypothetical protein
MRHNPFYNPYAKPGSDPHGKACFYIYNDDGTQAVGPTGPKFCYSAEKAQEIIKKVEARGGSVSASPVSPGPRAAPRPTPQSSAGAFRVGQILLGAPRGYSILNDYFYKVTRVLPNSIEIVQLEGVRTDNRPRYYYESWQEVPGEPVGRPARRAMLDSSGQPQAYRLTPWDGRPVTMEPYTD